MTRVRFASVAVAAALSTGMLGACAASSDDASNSTRRALERPTTTVPPSTTTVPPAPPCTPLDSLRPTPLPPAGQMPAGSFMDQIRTRGFLTAGVDEGTLGFASRNPKGDLEGLEIDLVDAISRAIFGDERPVRFISVVTANKVNIVAQGGVDLTASVISITCERQKQVDFSSEYYNTEQGVMVKVDSKIQSLSDLAGKKVCVTAGSTTSALLPRYRAIPFPVATRTDCLMALQQGRVDAIASHLTILSGLNQQDPKTTRVLREPFDSAQHYGIAIGNTHEDFVRFVNGVLEQMRADETLAGLYARDLPKAGIDPPPVSPVSYRPDQP